MADASPLPEGFQLDQAPSTTSNAGAATDTPVQTSELPEGFQLDEQKYGGTAQTIQAGLEGALRGAVSSPIASAIETKLGLASPAGIAARQEQHPVVGGIGEASTLIGGALTGTGEAAALESIGKGAVEAAGLAKAAPTYVARVGSAIVKNAAEMAAYQAQDEAGKALLSDPNVGAQSAIANIGLAAALGGAGGGLISGVASPLWEMAAGSKIAGGLRALVDHVGGTEAEVGAAPLSKAQTLAEQAGVEIPKDYAAVVNGTPGAMVQHSYLSQDDSTIFGRRYQKAGQELYSNLGTRVAEALGKTPDEVMNLPEKNLYETGQNLGATLHSELKKEIEPISNAYDAVTNKFKAAPVTSDVIRSISDQLAQKSLSEGWGKSFDDANQKLIEKIMQKLPEQATINDLKNAVSNLYRPFDAPDLRAAVEAKKIMSKGIETAIAQHMGPEEVTAYNQLRQKYSNLSTYLEDLDTHLKLGKWNGPQTFLSALKEKADSKGETLLSNMTGKNNAALLELLQNKPETMEAISNHYRDNLLRSATKNLNPGEFIKTSKLVRDIAEMTPQQKALIATPEGHQRIQAVNEIMTSLKDATHNYSNTARTLQKHMAGAISPMSLIAAMAGHADAGAFSYFGSMGLNEGRAALKVALLRFLGSAKPVSGAGFKAAAEYINAAQKGAKLVSTASENVFKPAMKLVLPTGEPSEKALELLDRKVADNDPESNNKLMAAATNGHVGHYMPEHQVALTASSVAALQYLRTLKPQPQTNAPLDRPIAPTAQQEARYQRALIIAQQPAMVMQHIKDGTLQPSDVQDLDAMYPAMRQAMSQKLTNDMIAAKEQGTEVPYHTRVSLSMFLGQPLDSTMNPQAIIAAQPAPKPMPQPQNQPMKGRKGKTAIDKMPNNYKTANQTAESDRSSRD